MTQEQTEQQLFFEQAAKDAAHSPIMGLLHRYFTSRQDAIFQLKAQQQGDDVLLDFISNAFGIWGGGSLENGWYEYAGGAKPHLELQDKAFNPVARIEGQQLIRAFRSLYRIPSDGQLSLF